MSFILDALRKSEHERERRTLPARVERTAGGAGGSRLSLVLGALGVLLLANLAVLGVYLLRPAPAPAATAPPAARAPALAQPAAPAAGASEPAPRTRPLEAEVDEGGGPALDVPLPPRSGPALVRAAPPDRAPVEPAPAPPLSELPVQSATGLPPLTVQLHVYAGNPAERFVVLNGQRLHEGDTLREGAVLERITPDGVVLNYRGTRFQLPRQ